MGLRLIHTAVDVTDVKSEAKVYRDAEWQEYRVRFYTDGVQQRNADYHTTDKDDAIATADTWVGSRRAAQAAGEFADASHVRAKNPKEFPDTKAMREYVRQHDAETLYASGAYGRKPSIKDWNAGKDFKAFNPGPNWVGGQYFSSRDAETLYGWGYRRIVFGGAEGFTVDLVMQ